MRTLLQLLFRNGGFVTFVLVEALCFYLIVNNNPTQGAIWHNSTQLATGHLQDANRRMTSYFSLSGQIDSLQAENAALRAELYNRRYIQIQLLDTLYRLRIDTGALLRLPKVPEYQVIPANIIGNAVNSRSNWITLNRGTRSGVTPNSAVIGPNGAVGIVRYVDQNFSRVMSLLHRQTKLSVSLKGQLGSLVWSESDGPSTMTLNDIPKDIQPFLGDTVLTSGYSTMFPGGQMVGTISAIDLPKGSNFYELKVVLSQNLSRTNQVYILKNIYSAALDSLQARSTRDE
jgi:rod shape-determining protein MreC